MGKKRYDMPLTEYYWYSAEQEGLSDYYKWIDGIPYTEITDTPRPFGDFEDYKLVFSGSSGKITRQRKPTDYFNGTLNSD